MPRAHPKPKRKTIAAARARTHSPAPPTISGRWLLGALAAVIAAAAFCVWLVLCLLFWQGSWQLLYHPSSNVAKTPASASLPFDPISFADTGDGIPQLTGWWISAPRDSHYNRYTVLYLHQQEGNLSTAIPALADLHSSGVNVFAFDYRGYGQSKFARPSETHWLEDANWALDYLTGTRHIDPHTIIVYGRSLGADLALEVAAHHRELAGVVADQPLEEPLTPIFGDPRARLVPAHLLVRDLYDIDAAGSQIHMPALWFESDLPPARPANGEPTAYRAIASHKTLVWLNPSPHLDYDRSSALTRWIDGL